MILQVVNGRHPLQELTVDTFIPNDVVATDAIPVQVITGLWQKMILKAMPRLYEKSIMQILCCFCDFHSAFHYDRT